jgi:hypothetical protein
MRRRRPQPLLVLSFVVIMGALMYAKDLPVSEPGLGLKVAAARLQVYYRETQPPTDWTIAAIEPRGGEVWVDLALPARQAAALAKAPRARLLAALRGLCPPQSDRAWSVLLKTQDIEVRGLGADGKALAAVSCRAAQK